MSNPTSTAIEKRKAGPEGIIEEYRDDFGLVLPSHVKPEQFVRLAQSAYRRGDARMREAAQNDVGSFLACLLDCARLGLEPGDTYHLVPFKGSLTGIRDWKGEVELMYRTGRIKAVKCEVVYANDTWEWSPTRMQLPVHERAGGEGPGRAGDWFGVDRGEMVGVYAYAELIDGGTSRVVVMTRSEVEAIKAVSKTSGRSDSIWNTWPDRAWMKTAMHQLWKWVPKSAEFMGEMAKGATALAQVIDARSLPAPTHDLPEFGDQAGELDDAPADPPPVATAAPDDDIAEGEIVDDDPAAYDHRKVRLLLNAAGRQGKAGVEFAAKATGREIPESGLALSDLTPAELALVVDALAAEGEAA